MGGEYVCGECADAGGRQLLGDQVKLDVADSMRSMYEICAWAADERTELYDLWVCSEAAEAAFSRKLELLLTLSLGLSGSLPARLEIDER